MQALMFSLMMLAQRPVDSPHEGPVTEKTFPCHEAVMEMNS